MKMMMKNKSPKAPLERPKPMNLKKPATNTESYEMGTVESNNSNPVLHKECKDVTEFGEELRQLVADMFASQHTAEGVGLAANQIGVVKWLKVTIGFRPCARQVSSTRA